MGIKFENASWYEVGGEKGIDLRCELEAGYDIAAVRKNIQVGMTKYLDWRFWEPGRQVEWDNLLEITKNTEGVKYVADQDFYPKVDEPVSEWLLPRIKKFVMRDLEGNVLFDMENQFSPVFYPAN